MYGSVENEDVDTTKTSKWKTLKEFLIVSKPVIYLIIFGLLMSIAFLPKWSNSVGALPPNKIHPNTFSHLLEVEREGGNGAADLVTGIKPKDSEDDFGHFAGYLKARDDREIFYQFFEAKKDAQKKAVFFWTNGGPGCSGLEGLYNEHGPYWVTDEIKLMKNPHSWNNEVNMVYLEQPYGVGFSRVEPRKKMVTTDEDAAQDFDAVVRSFLRRFPQYTDNKIFYSAESWGGHYMPTSALATLKNNEKDFEPKINFRGFLVGNPYTDTVENEIGYMDSLYGHGLLSYNTYNEWRKNCWGQDEKVKNDKECDALYTEAYYSAYKLYDAYALDFDYCPMADVNTNLNNKKDSLIHKQARKKIENLFQLSDEEYNKLPNTQTKAELIKIAAAIDNNEHPFVKKTNNIKIDAVENNNKKMPYFPCSERNVAKFLNKMDVQRALHVKLDRRAGGGSEETTKWGLCNDAMFDAWPETDRERPMQQFYKELVDNYNIQILIMSGDDDSVCSTLGTNYWLSKMDGWEIDEHVNNEPWKLNGQLAGFHTQYNANGKKALDIITVHTAGHMVPQTQPERALAVLQKFLDMSHKD